MRGERAVEVGAACFWCYVNKKKSVAGIALRKIGWQRTGATIS